VIASSEYEDYLCLLDLVWFDMVVDLEMVGCEFFEVEMKFWLHTGPQLPWRYEPVSDESIEKILARIRKFEETERRADAMVLEAHKARIALK